MPIPFLCVWEDLYFFNAYLSWHKWVSMAPIPGREGVVNCVRHNQDLFNISFILMAFSIFEHQSVISTLKAWGRDVENSRQFSYNMFNCIFLNKIVLFWFKFYWNLFLIAQSAIYQYGFCQWLCAEQATSHCLKQWWFILLTLVYATRPQWVKWLKTGAIIFSTSAYTYPLVKWVTISKF